MSALPHIGRTLRQRHRTPAQQAAPTAAERDLQSAIDRARHACMFAAPDDAARMSRSRLATARLARAARLAAIVTLLLWSAT